MITDLLEGLNDDEIHFLGEGSRTLELAAGDSLFKPGDPALSLYIIYSGEIAIASDEESVSEAAIVLGQGDFFGELAALENRAHSSVAVALQPSNILEVRWELLARLMEQHPSLSHNLTCALAARLRNTDRRLLDEIANKANEYRSLLSRSYAVNRVAGQLNDLTDWDDLWRRLLNFAIISLDAERGTVYLLHPDEERLVGQVIRGEGLPSISLPLGHGLAGYCAQQGEPLLIADAQADPRFASEFDSRSGFKSRAMLCAPFRAGSGQTIGVVQLINSTPDSFDRGDLDFLMLVSEQFVLARERATAVTVAIEGGIHKQMAPLLSRLTDAIEVADTYESLDVAKRIVQRATWAFAGELVFTAKPLRFEAFLPEIVNYTVSIYTQAQVTEGAQTYVGFLNTDRNLLRGAIEQVVDDYVASGSKSLTISGIKHEETLQINIVAEPPESGAATTYMGARLADKLAAFHQGSCAQIQSPDGSAALTLRLPLKLEST